MTQESCIPLLQEMSLETAEWVFANYGTFFRSMFTMFEITFSGQERFFVAEARKQHVYSKIWYLLLHHTR